MHDPFDYFHVVFDWNGAVIKDIGLAVTSINAIRTPLGLADVTLEDYSFHFGGAGAETQDKPDLLKVIQLKYEHIYFVCLWPIFASPQLPRPNCCMGWQKNRKQSGCR
jgi:hypothetical protein